MGSHSGVSETVHERELFSEFGNILSGISSQVCSQDIGESISVRLDSGIPVVSFPWALDIPAATSIGDDGVVISSS